MKKPANFFHLLLTMLLCIVILPACGDDDDSNPTITAPTITAQSGSTNTINFGETLTLYITASGGELSYQWYKDDTKIDGATNATYTKTATPTDAGSYHCIVTNTAGEAKSEAMAVTITTNMPDIIDDKPNKLKSTSFEVVGDLTDTLIGKYLDHCITDIVDNPLKSKFTIKNTDIFPVNYYVTIEKIAMPNSHYGAICIGSCVNVPGDKLDAIRYFPGGSGPGITNSFIKLEAGATTNPEADSYIGIYSGSTTATDQAGNILYPPAPGQTMIRVTYTNVNNPDDAVWFKLYWKLEM